MGSSQLEWQEEITDNSYIMYSKNGATDNNFAVPII